MPLPPMSTDNPMMPNPWLWYDQGANVNLPNGQPWTVDPYATLQGWINPPTGTNNEGPGGVPLSPRPPSAAQTADAAAGKTLSRVPCMGIDCSWDTPADCIKLALCETENIAMIVLYNGMFLALAVLGVYLLFRPQINEGVSRAAKVAAA